MFDEGHKIGIVKISCEDYKDINKIVEAIGYKFFITSTSSLIHDEKKGIYFQFFKVMDE